MNVIKQMFARLLARFNVAITKRETFDRVIRNEKNFQRYEAFLSFADNVNNDHVKRALKLLPSSKSEIFQDIFVALSSTDGKPGFFVEFGATDGIYGNNTWLLEKTLGWQGVLAEPALIWHSSLTNNRNCMITHDCVWTETGRTLEFKEASDAGFSSLSDYADKDRHAPRRAGGKMYTVQTVSLDDLLKRSNAPKSIDYISIDTEGSEYDILSNFPFSDWNISILTVEHNFREDRSAMYELMTANGFVRVLTKLSQFDDWYVSADLLPRVEAVFGLKEDVCAK